MIGKCQKPECGAPKTQCYLLKDSLAECEFWRLGKKARNDIGTPITAAARSKSPISWSGNTFGIDDISLVSERNSPIIIGLIGRAKAGKSSYLGMLYTLLLSGERFRDYDFSQSKTIFGWEHLAYTLRLKQGNVRFPDPTPSSPDYYGFLHLALRNNEGRLSDILFTDTSGEVFLQWSRNRDDDNARSARWIHENSSAFILFVDCEALIERRNAAKSEIVDIAQRLKQNLKGRPVIVVWSKADRVGEIPRAIRNNLKDDLKEILPDLTELEVTNFSKTDPDKLCHKNNLEVIDSILKLTTKPSGFEVALDQFVSDDDFLNYGR